MKILHTSDWHLGRSLCSKKRYDEFGKFLEWLAQIIEEHSVDALLVAGDVFDTTTPSNAAQELYYRFLCRIANSSCCRHVVVIAGNHDSPSFLDAPRELLKVLNVHVVGHAARQPQEEVLCLRDQEGKPELIVCAVPYLRDHDLRTVEGDESSEEKKCKLIEGLRSHYKAVATAAEEEQRKWDSAIPVVAMGHLFTAGGVTISDDGVRELYVGSLAHAPVDIFSDTFDYVALGHLHVPQKVGENEHIRYSGSPLPMGFGEAKQKKYVHLVTFDHSGEQASLESITPVPVPVFQNIEQIRGNWDEICKRLDELAEDDSQTWTEIIYDGSTIINNLRATLTERVAKSGVEILRIRDESRRNQVMNQNHSEETLNDLDVYQVFDRRLEATEMAPKERDELKRLYAEIVQSIQEEDRMAE